MQLSRRTAVLFLALLGATVQAQSQELGQRLFDQGIRATVALKDGTGALLNGTFHPELPMTGDFFLTRYGLSQRPLGTLRGPEGTSPQDLTEIAAAGLLAGLPRTFVATTVDWLDARMLKFNGQSWWGAFVDPLLAQLHRGEPPSGCVLPSVCMVPSPDPTCPSPRVCMVAPTDPTCPSPRVCIDPPPVCQPQPVLVAVPADVLETLRLSSNWINPIHPQQRRRLKAVYDWLNTVESVKGKQP
jgi:hypothetical protein